MNKRKNKSSLVLVVVVRQCLRQNVYRFAALVTVAIVAAQLTGCNAIDSIVRQRAPANNIIGMEQPTGSPIPDDGAKPIETQMEADRFSVEGETEIYLASYQELPQPEPESWQTEPQLQIRPTANGQEYRNQSQRQPQHFVEFQERNRSDNLLRNDFDNLNDPAVFEGFEVRRPRQKPLTQFALELQSRNRRLHDDNQELLATKSNLLERVSGLENRLDRSRTEILGLRSQLAGLSNENRTLDDQIRLLSDQLVRTNRRHKQDIEELTQTIVAFEKLFDDSGDNWKQQPDAIQQEVQPTSRDQESTQANKTRYPNNLPTNSRLADFIIENPSNSFEATEPPINSTSPQLKAPVVYSVLEAPMDQAPKTASQLLTDDKRYSDEQRIQ